MNFQEHIINIAEIFSIALFRWTSVQNIDYTCQTHLNTERKEKSNNADKILLSETHLHHLIFHFLSPEAFSDLV